MADEIDKKFTDEPLLTVEETWSVIEFARSMSGMYNTSYLNPELVSGRLRDITLNPLQATENMLNEAMISPKNSETKLQEFSQSFELTSMVYKRLLSYLGNMLAFDITYTSNAEFEDYITPKYKKDNNTVEKFLERFDYKDGFHSAVKEMLRNDAYFACFIDAGDRFMLQELPSEYCKITGRWEGGFLFSFNMYWFLQPGVDVNMYPAFFKKKAREIWGEANTTRNYDPSLPPELRYRSSWIYWVDVPVTVGVCFKLTPELATRLPYFTPLFNDLVLQPLIRNLQKNIDMAAASKIVMGEVPLLNKDSKATVKDTIAITPDLLGKFMALMRSAISDAVRVASAPLTNIRGIEFESDNEMYDKYLRTALASSGVNTNLIFSSNIKPNAIETQLSLNVDEQLMIALYPQFENFLGYWVNKYTKTYKFKFSFEGTNFFLDRDSRFEKQVTLFNQGIVLPQKIAAALGMRPAQLRKHMEEGKATGFMDMLTVPSVINQKAVLEETNKNQKDIIEKTAEVNPPAVPVTKTTAKAPTLEPTQPAKRGAPRKKASEISDEGENTRTQGTNIGRGGKVR
jgi:hypothetical protein